MDQHTRPQAGPLATRQDTRALPPRRQLSTRVAAVCAALALLGCASGSPPPDGRTAAELNTEAKALFARGDLPAASRVYRTAYLRAGESGDDSARANAAATLAILLQAAGESTDARAFADEAIQLLRKTRELRQLAGTYLVLGMIDEGEARHDDSMLAFQSAAMLFDFVGDEDSGTSAAEALAYAEKLRGEQTDATSDDEQARRLIKARDDIEAYLAGAR